MQNSNQTTPASFNINTFFTVVLILGAYFLGSFQTKVQILENRATQKSIVQAGIIKPTPDTALAATPPTQNSGKKPEVTSDDHFRGNKNANIVLVEYSDMECPFCKRFHPTMKQVIADYGDKVKWVYRHFPLSFHANAQKEAEAAECAAKLGGNDAFWKYVDAILDRTSSNGTGFALEKLVPLAKELGLNETKFKVCLDSEEFTQKVKNQITSGTEEGVTGTPGTIIINASGDTQLIPGAIPYEQIKPIIDKTLQAL